MNISRKIVAFAIEAGSSDIHLEENSPIALRINSDIKIGVLANVSDQYYFLENALRALKTKNPNLSYSFENELKNNQNALVNNDINFIYGFNYILDFV